MPVTRSFGVFFDLCLNKRLSKHSRGWWFETLSHPLWRHRNVWLTPYMLLNSLFTEATFNSCVEQEGCETHDIICHCCFPVVAVVIAIKDSHMLVLSKYFYRKYLFYSLNNTKMKKNSYNLCLDVFVMVITAFITKPHRRMLSMPNELVTNEVA